MLPTPRNRLEPLRKLADQVACPQYRKAMNVNELPQCNIEKGHQMCT